MGIRLTEVRYSGGRYTEVLLYLVPRVCFDLWELELGVIGVHFPNLLLGGGAEDFDDLHQLVNTTVAGEDGLAKQQLRKHATGTPDICTVSKKKLEIRILSGAFSGTS